MKVGGELNSFFGLEDEGDTVIQNICYLNNMDLRET
jgi:hypothetical protein